MKHKKLCLNLVTYQNYTKIHGPKNINPYPANVENMLSS